MTHRVGGAPHAAGLVAPGGSRPRRRWRSWLVIVLVLLLGAIVTIVLTRSTGPGEVVGSTTVTASSSATGTSPGDVLLRPGVGPGGWRSADETIGAWVQLSWQTDEVVHRIVLTRGPLARPGATEGFLTFGDGSYQQVHLSTMSPTTVVPITARPLDQVRFTVSAVSPGALNVSFTDFRPETSSAASDVVSGERPDGNAAPAATIRTDARSGPSDPRALQDGSGASGGAGAGAAWTPLSGPGTLIELSWEAPRELSSIQLVGAPGTSAKVASASLTFSDGAVLPVGAVLDDPARPTLVAFMPRAVTSVRITLDRLTGGGPVALAEIRAYERGATPPHTKSGAGAVSSPAVGTCAVPVSPVPAVLAVTCPTSASVAIGPTPISVNAAGFAQVTATLWPADGGPESAAVPATVDAAGRAVVLIDASRVMPGPFTVSIEATGPGREREQVLLQLYRPGRVDLTSNSEPPSVGRTLAFSEEFDRPVSMTRTGAGADYAAAKPTNSGAEDFGDAPFADPSVGQGDVGVADGLLHLGVEPSASGAGHVAGMLASARTGGSGFSAQYGYFEARMLAPAAPGTWPAFWLLPADNLVAPTPSVAEIDAVELYGHEPTGACQSTHDFRNGRDDGVGQCGTRFSGTRAAMTWHTYGVSVTPTGNTFYIDGQVVAEAPQVSGAAAPMFFLVDLALGGGWPVEMGGVGDTASLYVDYVRVYV